MQDENLTLTFRAKLYFYDTYFFYSDIKGDSIASYKYSKKIMDLFELHPEQINFQFSYYIGCIHNLLLIAAYLKKYTDMLKYLHKIEQITHLAKTLAEKARLFNYYNYHFLSYYINTGKFSGAVALVPSISVGLKEHESSLSSYEKIYFFLMISFSFFGMQRYNRSIFWLNCIRNELHSSVHTDTEGFLHLFYIMVHYEANRDYELLVSLVRSAEYFFSIQKRKYKFAMLLLEFFKKHLHALTSKTDKREIWTTLKKQIKSLYLDPYEKNILTYFDFLSWVDSKIQDRPFAEVVRSHSAFARVRLSADQRTDSDKSEEKAKMH